jgi:uncharacterized protein
VPYDGLSVTHNEAEQRYEARVGGQLAELDYRRTGDRVIFTHTGVPAHLGGQGIGSELVRTALDDARAQGLQVVPACSFVRWYIQQHPEYHGLVGGDSPTGSKQRRAG